jgi:hypothetical protein
MNNNSYTSIHSSIFSNKEKVTKSDGDMLDLHSLNYVPNFNSGDFVFKQIIIVREEHLCRMDLICQEVYNNITYVNELCK